MTSDPNSGTGGFFPGFLGDLMKLLNTGSPLQWDLAVQLAESVATGNDSENYPDPLDRIAYEELIRLVELHVTDVTGMTITADGKSIRVVTMGRSTWARRSLEGSRTLLEDLAKAMTGIGPTTTKPESPQSTTPAPDSATSSPDTVPDAKSETGKAGDDLDLASMGLENFNFDSLGLSGLDDASFGKNLDSPGNTDNHFSQNDPTDELSTFISQWTAAVAPAMLAMQFGSAIGHLARRALGQYELPLPMIATGDELAVVAMNIDAFAADWSLTPQDTRVYLAIRDVTAHAVLRRPHIQARLRELLIAYATNVKPDPTALQDRLGDPSGFTGENLGDLTSLLGDPSAFGELVETPELAWARSELDAFAAAFTGYIDWVTDIVARRMIGATTPIREAMTRRRVERNNEELTTEYIFGLRLDAVQAARGESFVQGVLNRSGERELAQLWVVESNIPTPAEIDAPGLWLERVNLPPG